jgi:hypothetical protein
MDPCCHEPGTILLICADPTLSSLPDGKIGDMGEFSEIQHPRGNPRNLGQFRAKDRADRPEGPEGALRSQGTGELDDEVCPSCGSGNFTPMQGTDSHVDGAGVKHWQGDFECESCHHRWEGLAPWTDEDDDDVMRPSWKWNPTGDGELTTVVNTPEWVSRDMDLGPRMALRVEWDSSTGEGWNGEYDPDDPTDTALLRFYVSARTYPFRDDQDFAELEGGSYCTATPADTPIEQKEQLLRMVAAAAVDGLESSFGRAMEEASWISPDWLTRLG